MAQIIGFNATKKEGSRITDLPSPERHKKKKKTKFKLWIYGAPYSGKTFFADTFNKLLVLNTDGNIEEITSKHISLKSIEDVKAVTNLLKNDTKYNTIAIDLIDDIKELARMHILDKKGIEEETDDNDWGSTWTSINKLYVRLLFEIMNTDKNIILVSHERSGTMQQGIETLNVKLPSLTSDKLLNKTYGYVHFVAHCRKRIITTPKGKEDKYEVILGKDPSCFTGIRPRIRDDITSVIKCDNNAQSFFETINSILVDGEYDIDKLLAGEKAENSNKLNPANKEETSEKVKKLSGDLFKDTEPRPKKETKEEIKEETKEETTKTSFGFNKTKKEVETKQPVETSDDVDESEEEIMNKIYSQIGNADEPEKKEKKVVNVKETTQPTNNTKLDFSAFNTQIKK